VVVVNNDGGGIFEFLPQAELVDRDEFEALLATPSGVEPKDLAGAYRLPHRLVESPSQLREAADEGTGVIEVRTGRRANVDLHRRISERVASELARLDAT
jgi:2-succinyl-5-enolpyruvyl-6-hydroxy-3-cyclohexene-1-carboxylate synthase